MNYKDFYKHLLKEWPHGAEGLFKFLNVLRDQGFQVDMGARTKPERINLYTFKGKKEFCNFNGKKQDTHIEGIVEEYMDGGWKIKDVKIDGAYYTDYRALANVEEFLEDYIL